MMVTLERERKPGNSMAVGSDKKGKKKKSTPARRPRARRKGSLTSKLARVSAKPSDIVKLSTPADLLYFLMEWGHLVAWVGTSWGLGGPL
eukprot:1154619-Pelagomonas_calceolata.AAC.2